MTEHEWDRKLNIDTIGRDASAEDAYHHPYEPTPYSVLEGLADSDYLSEENYENKFIIKPYAFGILIKK